MSKRFSHRGRRKVLPPTTRTSMEAISRGGPTHDDPFYAYPDYVQAFYLRDHMTILPWTLRNEMTRKRIGLENVVLIDPNSDMVYVMPKQVFDLEYVWLPN